MQEEEALRKVQNIAGCVPEPATSGGHSWPEAMSVFAERFRAAHRGRGGRSEDEEQAGFNYLESFYKSHGLPSEQIAVNKVLFAVALLRMQKVEELRAEIDGQTLTVDKFVDRLEGLTYELIDKAVELRDDTEHFEAIPDFVELAYRAYRDLLRKGALASSNEIRRKVANKADYMIRRNRDRSAELILDRSATQSQDGPTLAETIESSARPGLRAELCDSIRPLEQYFERQFRSDRAEKFKRITRYAVVSSLLLADKTEEEIASDLGLSTRTVKRWKAACRSFSP